MTANPGRRRVLRELEAWLERPMLVLSAIWLGLLVAELVWGNLRPLQILGAVIWVVFVLEFALRFSLAPRKARFLAANVVTMVALVVPAFRLFRVARVLRFARLARGATLVRVVAGVNRSMNALRRAMRRRGFGYILALTLVVSLLGALGMRTFEAEGPNAAAFATFADALWWTSMILTTMGSQAWPATAEGRILAVLLSVYAFAVFGYVAGALASFFVGRDEDAPDAPRRAELAALAGEIEALRGELRELRRGATPPVARQRGR
jgi:voltage-gated potassium channel